MLGAPTDTDGRLPPGGEPRRGGGRVVALLLGRTGHGRRLRAVGDHPLADAAALLGLVFTSWHPMPLLRVRQLFDHPDWFFELKHDGFVGIKVERRASG